MALIPANMSQRDTYMIRITELQRMDFHDFHLSESMEKALPDRPLSDESYSELFHSSANDEPYINSQHSSAHSSLGLPVAFEDAKSLPAEAIPPRRQSLRPSAFDDQTRLALSSRNPHFNQSTPPVYLRLRHKTSLI